MERSIRALLVVAGLGSLACACGPAIVMNPAGAEISAARLAAIPADGVEWEFDFDGNHDIKEDWTAAAKTTVNAAILSSVSARGGRYFRDEAIAAKLDGYLAFRHWAELVLVDVMNAAIGRLRDPPASVAELQYKDDLRPWREILAADHVLISFFLDGHNSTGRAIAVGLAGGWTARREAVSCAVRLTDGRLVWCARHDIVWDIRKPPGAQKVVEGMMGKMLDGAARTPPRTWPAAELPKPAPPKPAPPPAQQAPAAPVPQDEDEAGTSAPTS